MSWNINSGVLTLQLTSRGVRFFFAAHKQGVIWKLTSRGLSLQLTRSEESWTWFTNIFQGASSIFTIFFYDPKVRHYCSLVIHLGLPDLPDPALWNKQEREKGNHAISLHVNTNTNTTRRRKTKRKRRILPSGQTLPVIPLACLWSDTG